MNKVSRITCETCMHYKKTKCGPKGGQYGYCKKRNPHVKRLASIAACGLYKIEFDNLTLKKGETMTLSEAIEILKIEKGVCDLEISNGNGNKKHEDFSQAVDVVTSWVDKMYSTLMKLNSNL